MHVLITGADGFIVQRGLDHCGAQILLTVDLKNILAAERVVCCPEPAHPAVPCKPLGA